MHPAQYLWAQLVSTESDGGDKQIGHSSEPPRPELIVLSRRGKRCGRYTRVIKMSVQFYNRSLLTVFPAHSRLISRVCFKTRPRPRKAIKEVSV